MALHRASSLVKHHTLSDPGPVATYSIASWLQVAQPTKAKRVVVYHGFSIGAFSPGCPPGSQLRRTPPVEKSTPFFGGRFADEAPLKNDPPPTPRELQLAFNTKHLSQV